MMLSVIFKSNLYICLRFLPWLSFSMLYIFCIILVCNRCFLFKTVIMYFNVKLYFVKRIVILYVMGYIRNKY